MAITVFDNKEIMTVLEAKKKYADKYFTMAITNCVDNVGQRDEGYVILTSDKGDDGDIIFEELNKFRKKGLQLLHTEGWDVDGDLSIGSMTVVWDK